MEEVHVTVEGTSPVEWAGLCRSLKVKPLFIELNNFTTQLMCSLDHYDDELARVFKYWGLNVIRVKREVHPDAIPAGVTPLYYECHVKINGTFDPLMPMASRDLYQRHRWYCTKRTTEPFDAREFVKLAMAIHPDLNIVGVEYEACLSDTNEALDDGWR